MGIDLKDNLFSMIGLAIGLLNAVLPMNLINKHLFKVDGEQVTQETYSEYQYKFLEVLQLIYNLILIRIMIGLIQLQRKLHWHVTLGKFKELDLIMLTMVSIQNVKSLMLKIEDTLSLIFLHFEKYP